MFKLILSAILLFGFAGCSLDDENEGTSCGTLTVSAGPDKTATVNEAVVISGTVTKKDKEISEYEWRKGTEVLSTVSSFSHVPTTVGNQVLTFVVKDSDGCEASDKMTLTVKPVVNEGNGTPINSNGKYTWTNGELKVTVTSLKKTSNLITLDVVYENLSSEDISVVLYSPSTRLLDENGAIWDSKEDTANLFDGRTILPSKKIVTKIKFKARNATNGTTFDFIGTDLYYDELNHRILGIPVNLGN